MNVLQLKIQKKEKNEEEKQPIGMETFLSENEIK